MKYALILSSFVLLLSNNVMLSLNPLHSLYASVFGTENVSEYYQQLVDKALVDYGYTALTVPVKKMNSLAQRLIGAQLTSFTLFGIWLNEEWLNDCDENLRLWIIYHEVAHYIRHHHAKAIGLVALLAPPLSLVYQTAKHATDSRLGSLFACSLFGYGLHTYFLKPFILQQEQEADMMTVRVLYKKDHSAVIEHYLDYLENLCIEGSGDGTDGWHHTIAQQYEYINGLYLNLLIRIRGAAQLGKWNDALETNPYGCQVIPCDDNFQIIK